MTQESSNTVASTEDNARPKRKGKRTEGESFVTRVVEFIRETVIELRRVVWPTRKQVITYTIVVLVFVTFMSLLVSAIDLLVGRGVLVIFGN